jgi:hypothetical protein
MQGHPGIKGFQPCGADRSGPLPGFRVSQMEHVPKLLPEE